MLLLGSNHFLIVVYSVPIYPGGALKSKMATNKVRTKVTSSADVRRCPMTSWERKRPPAWGYRFGEVLWRQQGDLLAA